MGRSIVLEWDSRRVLVATGKVAKGSKPALSRAVGFDLPEGGESDEPMTLGESLAKGLQDQRVGKGEATVIVERTSAEMRMISVPPVPDEELPQVVRFQAGREFSNLTDTWLLDYVKLPSTANGQNRVLAAAISPQVAVQIRAACDKAGLELKRVMLRPFALARLLKRAGRLFGNLLVIERLSESVEMTIFSDANVQLTRSIRISSEASTEALVQQVLGEVRRTLGSFRNQQVDGEVNRALLIMDPPLAQGLSTKLKEIVSGDVDSADAWDLFEAGGSVSGEQPAKSYEFAAVLGALDDPTPDPATEIDFINPSKPPAPPSKRTRNIIIGVAAASLLVAVVALYWLEATRLDNQLKALQADVASLQKDDKEYMARMAEVDLLNQWQRGHLDWTRELAMISREMPMPDDAIVDNMTVAVVSTEDAAVVTIKGKASTPEMIRRIESELRDDENGREIQGKNNTPTNNELYRFVFDETMTLRLTRLNELREQEWDAALIQQQDQGTADASAPASQTTEAASESNEPATEGTVPAASADSEPANEMDDEESAVEGEATEVAPTDATTDETDGASPANEETR